MGPPDQAHQDKRVTAASSYARKAIEDPHEISDGYFHSLKSLFTTKELTELCTYVAFISGANKLGILLGLSEDDVEQSYQ